MTKRHGNVHGCEAGQETAHGNHEKLMEKNGLGPFSHGYASEPRQESDIIIDSADSPVSVLYTFICSVIFIIFAIKILGFKVQEKSTEHGAEIFTPLFLHF